MADDKKRDQIIRIVKKTAAVAFALLGFAVCVLLFLLFLRSEAFPLKARILFLICDGLMAASIFWLLKRYLNSDERG